MDIKGAVESDRQYMICCLNWLSVEWGGCLGERLYGIQNILIAENRNLKCFGTYFYVVDLSY